MKQHEMRYPTYDLELGAVVVSLKIWGNYLFGVYCTVYTDHKRLIHLIGKPNLNIGWCRWLDVVKDSNCEILYHSGKANVVADKLSCKLVGSSVGEICMRILLILRFVIIC